MSDIFDEQALRRDIVAKWGPAGAHVDVLDTMVRRIADLEAEVAKARAEEREAILEMLRLFIDEIIHTSHADGLGMGDQFREAVVAECIQRIQRRAQEASGDE
jgi:7,8-dihydro-6-hydroxymethylpterin-pyrophosphokinase